MDLHYKKELLEKTKHIKFHLDKFQDCYQYQRYYHLCQSCLRELPNNCICCIRKNSRNIWCIDSVLICELSDYKKRCLQRDLTFEQKIEYIQEKNGFLKVGCFWLTEDECKDQDILSIVFS